MLYISWIQYLVRVTLRCGKGIKYKVCYKYFTYILYCTLHEIYNMHLMKRWNIVLHLLLKVGLHA
jgi:hypothetical protein